MPTEQNVTRKLRAILSADVKGYSILMADDEIFTIKMIKEYRSIMSHCIEQYNGRVVDSPGDNVLSEFASAVDAVQCAVEIQRQLKKENDRLVEDKRLEFRIGVNIGDIVQDEDRIYGDGVNIAARIEGLADPAGICVSRGAYDQIKKKLGFGFEYMGEHPVKNISEPVRVYKVLMDSDSPAPLVNEVLDLPDKPSIAVLPFVNMSGDPSQEYFSDGLTEQIINGLCKVSNLFVIARNSSFAYKGKQVGIKQIARELGVKYVLEGSVQKAGDRVRITVQLIDATTDYHMWSENYDRDLSDIFALQDEITMKLISAMEINLTVGEQARLWEGGTTNIKAYDKCMRGLEYINRYNEKDLAQGRQLLIEAIDIDEKYAMPYVWMALSHIFDLIYGWSTDALNSFDLANKAVTKAIELNNYLDLAHSLSSVLLVFMRQYEKALEVGEKAIMLNPNGSYVHMFLGYIYLCSGKTNEAVMLMNQAFRLDPIPPPLYYPFSALAHRFHKEFDKAIELARKGIAAQPSMIMPYLVLSASYIELGMIEEAKAAANDAMRVAPKFSVEYYGNTLPYKNQEDIDIYINALRKAGLPD